jgi:energy-coupling factor transporter ATP-binding protein EcfA2
MIEQVSLTNFRKFREFTLDLRKGNILVGPNNAGKSSILDALRILEVCLRHTKNRNPRPISIKGFGVQHAYEIDRTAFPFSLSHVSHNYNDDDVIIEIKSSEKALATIVIPSDQTVKFFVTHPAAVLSTGARIRSYFAVDLILIPTLSPLEAEELYVTDATVQRNAGNRLASRILRNIWYRRTSEEFAEFSQSISEDWEGVVLNKPELDRDDRVYVRMFFSERRMPREVQWAGFGFQAWLQVQTHLRRSTPNSVLIIDEPDVYLHPDLQRKLTDNIRGRFPQFIMATHAIEIINDADANEIVTIQPENKRGRRIKTDQDYQSVYKYIGSGENAAFARMAKAKRVIFVEGDDGKIIRRFAKNFGLKYLADAQNVPILKLGGFSEWRKASAAAWAVGKILEIDIAIHCLFDRDYRCEDEIKQFAGTRGEEEIVCYVLGRKEIENYLLCPRALHRALLSRLKERNSVDTSGNRPRGASCCR